MVGGMAVLAARELGLGDVTGGLDVLSLDVLANGELGLGVVSPAVGVDELRSVDASDEIRDEPGLDKRIDADVVVDGSVGVHTAHKNLLIPFVSRHLAPK